MFSKLNSGVMGVVKGVISNKKNQAVAAGSSLMVAASTSQAAIDTTAAVTSISTDGTAAITAIGTAIIGLAAVAMIFRWVKASFF